MKPLTIVLPWSALEGDNHRLTRNRKTGQTFTTGKYRSAKAHAVLLMQRAHAGPSWDIPVTVWGRVFVPDRRRRDVGNFRKLVTDAMEVAGIVTNDCLVEDERWTKVGVDRAAPRMELIIAPYEAR